ncbi:hypothetical protein SteCoe_17946 [Stentor coeruleus]|uniref:Uncharacterized protein n=1 Tax=Stentor coeruleus TaxID=5963 RepID=A0A1R2BXK8_9CILI|nr:hypothetical protein SteCoe_17946 [Stentor coeruleus]
METEIEEIQDYQNYERFQLTEFLELNYSEFEKQLDQQITCFLSQAQVNIFEDTADLPKKRGRKKIRPFNPTKTEIMDKFWIRGFREFMKLNYGDLINQLTDREFWEFFLGRAGNPGKRRKYLSYSKHYKSFLASNKSFCQVFIAWMMLYGSIKIPRKNFKGNWDLYFNYLCTDLVQPCKDMVSTNDVKDSLRVLSSVFHKYISYVNEKNRIFENLTKD